VTFSDRVSKASMTLSEKVLSVKFRMAVSVRDTM